MQKYLCGFWMWMRICVKGCEYLEAHMSELPREFLEDMFTLFQKRTLLTDGCPTKDFPELYKYLL